MKKVMFVIITTALLCTIIFGEKVEAAASNQFLVINTLKNQLAYYKDGRIVKTFKVATGKTLTPTPTGKFFIVNKIKKRPYYSGNIKGGDPRNPLGDRWLGLNVNGTWGTTYAIHGNNNEKSIGLHVSAGCIRMHNKEIRWLYDRLSVYTQVLIVKSNASFNTMAKSNGFYAIN